MKENNESRVVTVAENAGFCFGVARAARAVEDEMRKHPEGERVFTLGKLIHNNVYNARLAAGGVGVVESREELENLCREATETAPVKVFVRAHGIPLETLRLLRECAEKNPCFSFVDCTCFFVDKIHKIVEKHSDPEGLLLVLGTASHPEVLGFCSKFAGQIFVFERAEELEEAIRFGKLKNVCAKSIVMVAQTTQKLGEWEKTKKIAKTYYAKPLIYDTICNVTEKRQIEAAKLSRDNDFMIVIGSRESSNSAKLYAICRAECEHTVMIENADEMRQYFPCNHKKVGIVAGASTPHDIIKEVEKTMSENFAELLETSLKTLNTGDTVTGYVTEVNDSEIYLDIGAKVTGVIKADKITDDPAAKLTEMFKIGDAVEAFVVRVSDVEGFATLDKKRVDSDKNWGKIVAAKENDEILEGTVIETVKGNVGVIVLVDSTRVFVHASQTGTPKNSDLSAMIGQKVSLKLTEVENKRAKGSISVVLREERKKAEAEFWATIEEGKQYTGKVKSMTSFGAFVDLGGVDGMVHTSELSWKRVKSPADVVAIGDEITVTVKSFDAEKKRISLTYKTDANNPWTIFKTNYAVGDIVSVKIVSMMPFGAFAEIVEGVDGLIHISEISMTRIAKPADVLEIGQIVDAKIVDVDDEKKKVSLSIKALLEEAKALAEAMPEEEAEATDAE